MLTKPCGRFMSEDVSEAKSYLSASVRHVGTASRQLLDSSVHTSS